MKDTGVQEPTNAEKSDIPEEQIAAFERNYAEALALSDALTEDFQKVKDDADNELEIVASKITELVGVDRDEDDLDDVEIEKYERLAEHERKLTIVSRVHGELIDRLELMHDGAPVGEDEENERRAEQTDGDRPEQGSPHGSDSAGGGDSRREDDVPISGTESDPQSDNRSGAEGGADSSEPSDEVTI
jgi:hypothetical protein